MGYHRNRVRFFNYDRCLTPEDGQGSRSVGQPRINRPLHGIRRKASKGLIRRRRVLQNPDHGFKSHRRLLNKGHCQMACKGLRKGAGVLHVSFDSVHGAWESKTVKGLGLPPPSPGNAEPRQPIADNRHKSRMHYHEREGIL
jgi:hypothetical protein